MSITDGMKVRTSKEGNKVLTLTDTRCWRCKKMFVDEVYEDKKTLHHSIPQRFKPARNIKIPICQACHNEINKIDDKCKRELIRLKNVLVQKVKSLEIEKKTL